MPRQIVLLRGINLGARNRIAMTELRELLSDSGFEDVRTYLQSGNVVLSSSSSAAQVARTCEREIEKRFGLDIDVVVRTRAELAWVIKRDPLGEVAVNPKRYQVSFLADKLDSKTLQSLTDAVAPPEQFVVIGREVYAWHPEGIGRSRLWSLLAGRGLGVAATARNWNTVTNLLALADE